MRIGEASHPGPSNATNRMRAAAGTIITHGREHVGETFAAAYKDKDFVSRVVKRAKPKHPNLAALQAFFKAKDAKNVISKSLSEDPPLDVPAAEVPEESIGADQWAIVPYNKAAQKRTKSRRSHSGAWLGERRLYTCPARSSYGRS